MDPQKHTFQAEVSRLLDIVAHSLYSEKQIFLRELISNASDACDRLRYAALTQPELAAADAIYKIALGIDKAGRTLTISDNGIGMNRDDLVENLGTIARSGTAAFVNQLSGDQRKDVALIGQFGVGFYSSFMIADKVEVLSRKAGDEAAWLWTSDGRGEYTVAPAEKASRGTLITLHLRAEEDEFLEPERLRHIVKTYSDHIAIPIVMAGADGKEEAINAASALWTRSKNEITADQYKEFYHHVGHGFDDPWLTIHYQAEGRIAYAALVFVPTAKPFDLFHPERKHRLKLYVKRVFITESVENLVPAWLRFLKGVVDSDDLPLNISREMLQHNPVLAKIKAGLTKRVIGELVKKAETDAADYAKFWENFGAVLKEGLYEPAGEHRDQLLRLVRAHSTAGDGLVSLADYVGRMKEGQDAIYTITGESLEAVRASPQLEGFKAKGIEVLLLTDPIDEFWLPAVDKFEGKAFKSATRGGVDLSKIKDDAATDGAKPEDKPAQKDDAPNVATLTALLKLTLGEAVKDVRASERLTDSAVCLIADEGDMDIRLERLLRQHKQLGAGIKRVLEINPRHELIGKLSALIAAEGASGAHKGLIEDAAFLLLDQARILEGEPVPDPRAFARRMAAVMAKGFSA
jgi:molecular chaperone HtpG